MGQGTLGSTTQLLLRVFSCELFVLRNRSLSMRVQTYIHILELGNKQYTIQESRSIEHAHDIWFVFVITRKRKRNRNG
jgi:isoprenylcysteine carboxyl methyltransferase (ICMT) family protein YpbQ